ncbi:unnamed protein product [Sphenostylis stenocarpa]|uniref:Uncharacterized protein n=1 Tax=Sphenostylis stenocarpa TaxID=92480 RepID=A0AA86TJR8_9FABA|nr:unnamed protein product [Sphenostylis stenocarpa]
MSSSWLYSFSTRKLKMYTVISTEKTIHEALPLIEVCDWGMEVLKFVSSMEQIMVLNCSDKILEAGKWLFCVLDLVETDKKICVTGHLGYFENFSLVGGILCNGVPAHKTSHIGFAKAERQDDEHGLVLEAEKGIYGGTHLKSLRFQLSHQILPPVHLTPSRNYNQEGS